MKMNTELSFKKYYEPGNQLTNSYYINETEVESLSPFRNTVQEGSFYDETEPVSRSNSEIESYFDGELSSSELSTAVKLNAQYMKDDNLKWGRHLDQINKVLSKETGVTILLNGSLLPDKLAFAVDKYQQKKGLKPTNKGVIGSGTFSLLQKDFQTDTTTTTKPVQPAVPSRWLSIIKDTVPCPAEPLLHGKETYKRMVDAIKTATQKSHYIYILGWMLDCDFEMIPGDPGSTLYNLLARASEKGVEIRILIWDNIFYINEINNASAKINRLPNAMLVKDNFTYGSESVKAALRRMRSLIDDAPSFLDQFNSWNDFKKKVNIVQNEGSHHEKVLVVKGSEGLIGFCGGIDINPNRVAGVDSKGRSNVLHDVHCEVRGYAAWVLLHRFKWRWQVLNESKHFLPVLVNSFNEAKPGPVVQSNTAHVKILQTYNHPTKNIKDRSVRETVRTAIANARTSIHIEDQYMISLEIALWLNLKLKEPGFKSVSILTQDDSFAKPDMQFPKAMRKKFIDYLCMGLTAAQIKEKVFIRMLHPDLPPLSHHQVHSKIYIIDSELAIIGSANLSSRSMTNDSETAAVIFNDSGTPLSFVSKLQGRMNYDPLQSVVPYVQNPNVLDKDVEISKDIEPYIPLMFGAAGGLSVVLPGTINIITRIVKLIPLLKPAFIDIIDPDADGTIPQQETEDNSGSYSESKLRFESETTNASNLNDWAYLLSFKVPDELVSRLKSRDMEVQYAHNESYSNDLNFDFYRLRIDKYPTVNGVTLDAKSLIRYIRLNINSLVDTSYCDWTPYSPYIDTPLWYTDDPTGTVLRQDIKGPDNASVFVSVSRPNGWRFTTVTTPQTGRHPVSGHREFFIGKDSATNGTYFVIKGLDMMSTGIAGMGLPLAGSWGYAQGDALWKSMREKIIAFINANGGSAKPDKTYAQQIEWRFVYRSFKNLLEQTFGKGAGSAENSPFITFQVTEGESFQNS